MKKFLLSILVIASCGFAASAQTRAGDMVIGFNLGFGGLEDTTYGLNYEYIVADNLFGSSMISFGIGANAVYYGYSNEATVDRIKYRYDHDNFIFSARGAFHASPIRYLDLFLGANLGAASLTETETFLGSGISAKSEVETEPKFVYGGVVGARYYFLGCLGLGVEGSFGSALSTVSVSLLFAF